MVASQAQPVKIFIGFHPRHKDYLDALTVSLASLGNTIRLWSRQDLRAGYETDRELKQGITSAQIAILLVSMDYLASSDFLDKEFPLLSATKGLLIIPVIVGYCAFAYSPLKDLIPLNDPDAPVSSLTNPQKEKFWLKVLSTVRRSVEEINQRSAQPQELISSPQDTHRNPGNDQEITLTGPMRDELCQALDSAYPSEADLSQLISYAFNKNLHTIAGGRNLSEITFNLIGWAESNGVVRELIHKASDRRPGNPLLKAFVARYLNP